VRRTIFFVAIGALVSGAVLPASAATVSECRSLTRHGRRAEALACYQSLAATADHYFRAEGYWGLEQYQDANNEFRAAVAAAAGNALYRVRWGRLLHERFNDGDAADLFNEALKRDPKNADAYVGLALVAAEGVDTKVDDPIAHALELDPKSVEAHEVAATFALEASNIEEALKQADAALELATDSIDAMAIHAAAEIVFDRSPDAWLQKMTAVNASYGNGYAIVAFHLVQNRRYEEGVAYYRKAVELDPRLWSARSQLGINLMRLGQEDEPRRQLELCYNNGYRDAATVNSLRLLDSYKNFSTFKDDTVILKLNTKEADLLRPYFSDLAKRAIANYAAKYKITLPGPVQVEVYPDHEDFAVRTMGLPGLGALGVTFESVIAMDSPSGRKPGSFNWAATLWHEMNHVFVLTATNFRVPRWFAEGLAVHEEGQGNPQWSDRLTPDIVVAFKNKKLLPVAELDRGFVHQEYPGQVQVSYFQAGRICDFIQSRWGADKLVEMVHAFAGLRPTPEVIQQTLGLKPEEFDRQFLEWLSHEVAPIAEKFDEWRAHLKAMVDFSNKGQKDEAQKEGEAARALYPQYVWDANPYEFLAESDLAKGDKAAALAVLAAYRKFGGEDPETLKKLASLQEEAGQLSQAAATLDALNDIFPIDADLHRRFGALGLKEHNYPASIREYAAAVALHPLDKAGALYDLAEACFEAGQFDDAELNVLGSLEAAPGFRPAQKLLLQIEDAQSHRPK
jgi:tetratricopeptide (TPR) repeat protein